MSYILYYNIYYVNQQDLIINFLPIFPFLIYNIYLIGVIKIELKYTVLKEDENKKVGNLLQDKLNISSRLLTKLKMNGKILVNRTSVFSSYIVHENDEILVNIDFDEEDNIIPEAMNLDILYEDDYLLAINKPFGTVVHPSSNHLSKTLANGVKHYLNNNKKIRAINRLDRDTSGIVLFAKNEYIQELMITNTKIEKEYLALTIGKLPKDKDTLTFPIARKEGSIMEREVNIEGQSAITHYGVIRYIEDKNISLVHLKLETGRTHQIRVHLAYIGNSILGDSLYGCETNLINRQALHAYKTSFKHPITKEKIKIEAPLPNDIESLIK